uniref:Thyroid adenoma-associated protein homolog n=1 Tax=Crassostrea virginica TaxID=6565 RepID=A0A8B8E160_CRAVI|nr:thyroid adenoma-associated protein homolog [Crassostrea virginica]XP_022333464.1 thyroid adenoma-associated protein homolog [Crassostrea virginica]
MDLKGKKDLADLIQEQDWIQLYPAGNHCKIRQLFVDLIHYRSNDIHKLLRNLEEVLREWMSLTQTNADVSTVHQFINVIIRLYCHCIENIKLARAIERFLGPLKIEHSGAIQVQLGQVFWEIIENQHPSVQKLTAASCLLEQSEIVRDKAEQNISQVLSWTLQQLSEIRVAISTSGISKENLLTISAVVKVVLQLFQSCPSSTCAVAWSTEQRDRSSQQTVKQILLHLFQILNIETLTADVKMLSGTAIGIYLASAPTEHTSIRTFWTVFSNVFQGSISHVSSFDELITEGEIEEHSLLQLRLGAVAMVKGMLACASDKCLAFHSREYVPFCVELFTEVHEYCMGPISLRYHAFNLLQTWFSKFLHLVSTDAVQCKNFIQSYLMKKTLDIVWLNWDSPVDDVSELATGSLKHLFEVWEVAHKDQDRLSGKDPSPFYSSILLKLKSVAWYIKGQYRVMSALVPYVGSQFIISEYPTLPGDLLKCMTTNYLASASADVYKTLVADIKDRSDRDRLTGAWEATWWSPLLSGLCSVHTLQRNNVNQYWIPSTTRISQDLGVYIQNRLEKMLNTEKSADRAKLLFSYLSVSKVIRATQVCTLKGVELIKEGLSSYQDEIRSEAVGLVCVSQKKAEPLSEIEDMLLRDVLPLNLKVDSAPFRQHLVAHLKRLLTRVRDGAIALTKTKDSSTLELSLQFIEWLHSVCMNNLVPGACYQRRKTCLEVLAILYETFQYNEKAKQRKSFTPESTKRLNHHVKEKGLWDFFCYHSNTVLISCLLDGADDIQEVACSLLLEYFTWPLDGTPGPSGDGMDGSAECHLLSEALRLCNSPKPYQCQSGTLMCKLVFSKCVVENGWQFSIQADHCTCNFNPTAGEGSPINAFLNVLLEEVKQMLVQSKSAPVQASKSVSIHGYVTSITRCLTECPQLLHHDIFANLKQHYLCLIQLNIQIIQTMLGIMARGSESEGCPSFAEIGQALESLIVENEEDYSQTEALSGEHQYLLSWCWVNIKESCLSLGHLSRVLISYSVDTDTDVDVIQSVAGTFSRVLTQCRHRGVIEGCRTAFSIFCSALFESNSKHLNYIPQKILAESMEGLKAKAASTSTTRKSAGLPVIIQSIVSCERRNKKSELLRTTLDGLFSMAELPLEKDVDDRHDLPQVHALNILKCLYGDSGLHEALMQFIGKAVILVVEQFGSPAWSVRNAATRLFSVLITRLFGQKKIVGFQACNTKSLLELSAHYPELIPFLLQSLESALQREITAIDSLHPSLFPVLTILSNMGRLDQESESSEALPLRSFVKSLIRSPVYFLRQLSSAAFVSLVPQIVTLETIEELVTELLKSKEANFIHGAMVSMEMLFNRCNEIPEGVVKNILDIQTTVALLPDIVTAQYVCLLHSIMRKENQKNEGNILEVVRSLCSSIRQNEQPMPKPLTQKACVDCLMQRQSYSICLDMLTKEEVDADVKLHVIETFTGLAEDGKIWEMFPQMLQCIQVESYPPLKSALVSCMTTLYIKLQTLSISEMNLLKEIWQQNKTRIYDRGVWGSAVLEMGCVYMAASMSNDQFSAEDEDVLLVCDAMHQISSNSDWCKQALQYGLMICGQGILRLCEQRKGKILLSAATKLFFCVWNLVQDDDCDVREYAAIFIAKLSQEFDQYASLQCNICLQEWINYFSDHFWWSVEIVNDVFLKLYQPHSVCQISKKLQLGKQLYEAEDNSFYSEAIFNSEYIYQMLQKMLSLRSTNGLPQALTQKEVRGHDLMQDLHFIEEHLYQLDSAVINDLYEPANFKVVIQLLFKVRLLLQEKPACLNKENISQMHICYNNIITNKKIPWAVGVFLQE